MLSSKSTLSRTARRPPGSPCLAAQLPHYSSLQLLFSDYVIHQYGLKLGYIVFGVVMLQALIGIALQRPPQWEDSEDVDIEAQPKCLDVPLDGIGEEDSKRLRKEESLDEYLIENGRRPSSIYLRRASEISVHVQRRILENNRGITYEQIG